MDDDVAQRDEGWWAASSIRQRPMHVKRLWVYWQRQNSVLAERTSCWALWRRAFYENEWNKMVLLSRMDMNWTSYIFLNVSIIYTFTGFAMSRIPKHIVAPWSKCHVTWLGSFVFCLGHHTQWWPPSGLTKRHRSWWELICCLSFQTATVLDIYIPVKEKLSSYSF